MTIAKSFIVWIHVILGFLANILYKRSYFSMVLRGVVYNDLFQFYLNTVFLGKFEKNYVLYRRDHIFYAQLYKISLLIE